jgi:hypothetical protein
MVRKLRGATALALVTSLAQPAGLAWAQERSPARKVEDLSHLALFLRPDEAARNRDIHLSQIKPPLESLSEACRQRCGAAHQAAVDAVQAHYKALIDLYNAGQPYLKAREAAEAARKRLADLSAQLQDARKALLQATDPQQRAELLRQISTLEPKVEAARNALPELENAEASTGAALKDAYKAYEPTYARMAGARTRYEQCVKSCGDEGGGMGTGTKVVLGTAILGGIGVGVVKATQGGGDTPTNPPGGGGGTPPPAGGTRTGIVTLTIPFGQEVYRGEGPSGADGNYRGAPPRVANNCPSNVVFPPTLDMAAAASGFGAGGAAGGFAGAVTGTLFNAQLNLTFQQALALARYTITVPLPGGATCQLVYEGPLQRQ